MKRTLLVALLVAVAACTHYESPTSADLGPHVSLKVYDLATKAGVPGAVLQVRTPKDGTFTAVTDANGVASVAVPRVAVSATDITHGERHGRRVVRHHHAARPHQRTVKSPRAAD